MRSARPTPSARPWGCTLLLWPAILVAACGGSAPPDRSPAPPLEVLATGSTVARFGTLGEGGFWLRGFDASGRAVVTGLLSDGRIGLFGADGGEIRPLWISGDDRYGVEIHPTNVSVSPSGLIAALAADLGSIALLDEDGWRTVVGAGVRDDEGALLCDYSDARINDDGALAFVARVVPPGGSCGDRPEQEALYVLDRGSLQRLALSVPSGEDEYWSAIELIGISRAGEVVFGESPTGQFEIVRVKGGERQTLYRTGDIGPSGLPLQASNPFAASSAGDITFAANEGEVRGVYRASAHGIELVAAEGDHLAGIDLRELHSLNNLYPVVNERGEVAFDGAWHANVGGGKLERDNGIFLLDPSGEARLVVESGSHEALGSRYATPANGLFVNDAGQVAFGLYAFGGRHANVALRWQDDELTELIGTGDPAAGSAVFAEGGFGGTRCLAPDGSVAISARATNNDTGFLCGDDAGFATVARTGDPDPFGGELTHFDYGGCEFTDGGLVFAAARSVPIDPSAEGRNVVYRLESGVYRALPAGVERLVGAGDLTDDGDRLLDGAGSSFAANPAGDVVVRARAAREHTGIYRLRDGVLARVGPPFAPLSDELESGVPSQFGVTSDGEVVMLVWRRDGAQAVIVWREGQVREVFRTAMGAVDLGRELVDLIVRGRQVVLQAQYSEAVLQLDLDDGQPRLVTRAGEEFAGRRVRHAHALDLTPEGRLLLSVHFVDAQESSFFVVRAGAEPEEITAAAAGARPFALNDDGIVASLGGAPSVYWRAALTLSGGLQGASCVAAPTPGPAT